MAKHYDCTVQIFSIRHILFSCSLAPKTLSGRMFLKNNPWTLHIMRCWTILSFTHDIIHWIHRKSIKRRKCLPPWLNNLLHQEEIKNLYKTWMQEPSAFVLSRHHWCAGIPKPVSPKCLLFVLQLILKKSQHLIKTSSKQKSLWFPSLCSIQQT